MTITVKSNNANNSDLRAKTTLLIFIVLIGFMALTKPKFLFDISTFKPAILTYIFLTLIYLCLILVLYHRLVGLSPIDLGFRVFRWDSLPCLLKVITIFCLVVVTVFFTLHYFFMIKLPGYEIARHSEFYAFLWSPVVEEIIFRGVLVSSLAVLFGWRPVIIIIDGALFALIHFYYGNPNVFNFTSGYFLAWVFYRTRSLILPFIFHLFGNIVVNLFSPLHF